MTRSNNALGCRQISWLVALLAGIVLAILLHEAADWGWVASVLSGVVLCVIAGLLLAYFFCGADVEVDAVQAPAAPIPAPAAPAAAPAKMAPAAKAPEPAPVAKPATSDGTPEVLGSARAGGADDLKKIKGVGPALEKTLNELGFYHFDQIANWGASDIEWVDSRLKFKGRIVRDDWMQQAKVLMSGGTTEFAAKVEKGGVYKDDV